MWIVGVSHSLPFFVESDVAKIQPKHTAKLILNLFAIVVFWLVWMSDLKAIIYLSRVLYTM